MRIRAVLPISFACLIALAPPMAATDGRAGQPAAAAPGAVAALAAAPDQTLTHEGVTLRYKDVGTGDAVVLIHGYSTNLESMFGLGASLAAAHRVVAFDVRGFGKSSKFAQPARYGQAMVDDVVRLMDHLKIRRAHVIGHSMGALIGANVASRYPARVMSATLIAGPFYPERATFTKEVGPWVADLESGKGLANFMQWLFPRMDPKMAAGFSAQAVKSNDLQSLIAVMRSLPELTISGLKAPGVPALVAVGTGDPLHPLSGRFVKASPGATLLEIEGADHLNVAANPDFARAMRELIQRATAGTSAQRDAA